MAYTLEQANTLLAGISTEAELRNLISQLDINATGQVTILYSGRVSGGVSSRDIIKGMLSNGDDIRVLDQTEAARFLDMERNTVFTDALKRIFHDNPSTPGSTANQFLNGTKGAWDIISANFAAETVGEVRTLTSFADPSRKRT